MARKRSVPWYVPCPNAAQHNEGPSGYLAWRAWAERMSKTHRQVLCDGCKRWQIWVPKSPSELGMVSDDV